MEEVTDLLVAWGLPDLQENFIKNEINLQALSALTPEGIKELITPLGPRTLFIRNWKEWNPNINTTIDSNMSLPGGDFSNLDIISLSDITVQDFNAEEKTETDVHVLVAEQSKTSPKLDLASTKTTTSFYVIENNLEEDFNACYPEEQNNFYLNFPGVKKTLIKLLKEKKSKDASCKELIQLADDSSDEEKNNLAAILSLPELINPSIITLPMATTTSSKGASPPSKKRKVNKEKKWKPSKAESRDAFVTHVQDDSYLKLVIDKKHQNHQKVLC